MSILSIVKILSSPPNPAISAARGQDSHALKKTGVYIGGPAGRRRPHLPQCSNSARAAQAAPQPARSQQPSGV
jgi:hypothetical protein